MQINEFIDISSRAERYFEKDFSEEQRKIMFEELKNVAAEKYQKAINTCIRTSKFLPKLADILRIIRDIDDVTYEEKPKIPCKICGGSGYIRYYKILQDGGHIHEYQFICSCICENAPKNEPNFEQLGIKPGDKIPMSFN